MCTYPFGLWDKEECSHTNGETEASIDEVRAVPTGSHSIEHDWCGSGDDQIEDPLGARGIGDGQAS